MEQGLRPIDYLLNAFRHYLEKFRLISLVRTGRLLFHFGPWRVVPRFIIRKLRPVARTSGKTDNALFADLNAADIAAEIQRNSVAVIGTLPPSFLQRLCTVTDQLPVDHYQLMHLIDPDIYQLAEDPAIKDVLRRYFRCEPVLLESTLMITGDCDRHGRTDQNVFHIDYAAWESLNVFVYLSDVTDASSCHVVVRGSHRAIGFRDLLRGFLPDGEASHRFGDAIHAITGPAGTVFLENTEAFHRRFPGNDRRVMLNLLYASHRSWLSHGRTSRVHMDTRAKVYALYSGGDGEVAGV